MSRLKKHCIKGLIFFTISFSLLSCKDQQPVWEENVFFPDHEKLKSGVVNKYYIHYYSNDRFESSTDIEYQEYIIKDEKRIILKTYNAGLELTNQMNLIYEDQQFNIEKEFTTFRNDSIYKTIPHKTMINIKRDSFEYGYEFEFENIVKRKHSKKSIFLKDTIIENSKSKIISAQYNTENYFLSNNDTTITNSEQKEYYVSGLGLFEKKGNNNKGDFHVELIEQISKSAFEKRRKNDFKKTPDLPIDKIKSENPSFYFCDPNAFVFDYYYGKEKGGIAGGKKSLWLVLKKELNPDLLNDITGCITFRIIINCEGEIGWMNHETYTLDYQPTTFPIKATEHLHSILANQNFWKPSLIQDEHKDTYIYLTFKIKNGKIIEILP